MKRNYDAVASFYDALAQLIYGRAIVNAQLFLLQHIPANSHILIVGGGTGWILEELTRIRASGLHITYIELSQKMMQLSKNRNTGSNNIAYITGDIEQIIISELYDVIITPFIFDNFKEEAAAKIFGKLHVQLLPSGLWMFADFTDQQNRWRQKILLKTMYFFFTVICKIQATTLPDMASLFKRFHYNKIAEQSFYKTFISSIVYQKPAG